jgi:hypothetical protein
MSTPILSMSTESGASEILLPTDHPSFVIETAYLRCFSLLAEDITKKAHLRVIGTASGGGTYASKFMPLDAVNVEHGPDLGIIDTLQKSPILAKIAFVLNKDKLSGDYFSDLDSQYRDLRSSLVALGIWDTVTSVGYNPSVQFSGETYAKTLVRDDALFNSVTLDRTLSDLQNELRIRSKKIRVPLTSYDARIDVAVILTGVVLLSLQFAYTFTLHNITALAAHVSIERIGFFPWAILWASRRQTKIDIISRLRPLVVGLAFVHSFLAASVLAWVAVSMLRFGTGLFVEACISTACCLLAAVFGYLSFSCIRQIFTFAKHN